MNYLERLGIHTEVRSFFQPCYLAVGDTIKFHYDRDFEHVSPDFHKIPKTGHWIAGQPQLSTEIFICYSAMEAVCYLHYHHARYHQPENLCFISAPKYFAEINQLITQKRRIHLLSGNDELGAVCDLAYAARFRNKAVRIRYREPVYQIIFENKTYTFSQLSLNALEKASGYNFRIRTHKPKNAISYYEQLKPRYRP